MRLFGHKSIPIARQDIRINKPAADVWQVLIDINAWGRWSPVIRHAVLYGPIRIGTAFKCISDEWDFQSAITELQHEHRLVLSGKTIGARLNMNWNLRPIGNETSVGLSAVISGWLPAIFTKRARNRIESDMAIWLRALKARVERPEQAIIEQPLGRRDEIENSKSATVFKTLNLNWTIRKGPDKTRGPWA